jgi:hypothetical protein
MAKQLAKAQVVVMNISPTEKIQPGLDAMCGAALLTDGGRVLLSP